ncbi:capsule assembly Wzi family protein [Larkinella soli]|uniref:capsule assembly Wzi family protein n=1 Tax=Larkinella soli TaxID=1770527 RepID=UPI000FFBD259|nr:capsule assembly Wzi family protein [Larkinella soli]
MRALLLLIFCPLILRGQPTIETRPTRLFAELGGFYSTSGHTPFWLRANQFGIVPGKAPYATMRVGIRQDYRYYPVSDSAPSRRADLFGWGYGVEAVGNVGPAGQTQVILPEIYVRAKFSIFEVMGGRRREIAGLVDSTLSSGSYSWSGNSLPVPKIQISLPDYTPIGFTKGILSFRGNFAHGWFEGDRFVRNSYLHQKSLYGRLGKPNWPIKLYGGFNHQVMWGGRTDQLTEGLAKNGRLPSRLQDFAYVVVGNSLGRILNVDTTRYSTFDRENRVGNHLGTLDLGMEISTKKFSILLYRQSLYEDGSLFYFTNFDSGLQGLNYQKMKPALEDGLNGIRYRNLNPARTGFRITGAALEFLFTKSQGGGTFNGAVRGRDNYFNHAQFRDGWSYLGRGIGTPFITPLTEVRQGLSSYGYFANNRVRVYHAGIQGAFAKNCVFRAKFSYSENYGTYDQPFPKMMPQFSSMVSFEIPVEPSGYLITVSAAADQGDLLPRSQAVFAGVRKTWDFYKYRVRQ